MVRNNVSTHQERVICFASIYKHKYIHVHAFTYINSLPGDGNFLYFTTTNAVYIAVITGCNDSWYIDTNQECHHNAVGYKLSIIMSMHSLYISKDSLCVDSTPDNGKGVIPPASHIKPAPRKSNQ